MDPTRWPHASYSDALTQQEPTHRLDDDQGAGGGRPLPGRSLRQQY